MQAAEKYLRIPDRPARGTKEIADARGRRGLTTNPGSVSTILGRTKDGSIELVKRGLWRSAEWYKEKEE